MVLPMHCSTKFKFSASESLPKAIRTKSAIRFCKLSSKALVGQYWDDAIIIYGERFVSVGVVTISSSFTLGWAIYNPGLSRR